MAGVLGILAALKRAERAKRYNPRGKRALARRPPQTLPPFLRYAGNVRPQTWDRPKTIVRISKRRGARKTPYGLFPIRDSLSPFTSRDSRVERKHRRDGFAEWIPALLGQHEGIADANIRSSVRCEDGS